MGRPPLELAGKRFGKLCVLRRAPVPRDKLGAWWHCQCDCGRSSIHKGSDLASERINSCGCLLTAWRKKKGAMSAKHSYSRRGNKTYAAWCAMRQRCFDKNSHNYKDYGGRGITVCGRWNEFKNFLADMGEAPPGLSLDRYPNNDGNYEPTNCRWATAKEQANNRRPRKCLTSTVSP